MLLFALATPTAAAGGPITDWLSYEDPVERCPTLVVLNGDQPARVDEAARLFRSGVAREVWLTSDPRSADSAGRDAGTDSNAARLVTRGDVPASAIHLVAGAATSTRAELEVVAAELSKRNLACAVLVTSPLHARRVRVTWHRVVGDAPRAIVRHAPGAGYTGWRVEFKELALALLALIGLPR